MEQTKNEQQQQQSQGWKDVQLRMDMPLVALVQFLNVLNQRLVTIENIINIKGEDGKEISLTEFYKIQTEQELKAQTEAMLKQEENKELKAQTEAMLKQEENKENKGE